MSAENVADLASILAHLVAVIGMRGANEASAYNRTALAYRSEDFDDPISRVDEAADRIHRRAADAIAEQERMERVHERLAEVRAERARRERDR
jgi:flagellin-like hook-associated protein FlgL